MENPIKNPTQWATANPVPVGWMRQFRYLTGLFDKIHHIDGDVVECGLGEGNTLAMLAYLMASEHDTPRHVRVLHGFDSFEGWPEPTELDASPRNPQKGEWKVSEDMVRQRLRESGISHEYPELRLRIVKGFLDATLPFFPPLRQIAFLHLDVDLYRGYHDALTLLFPKVAQGGIVAFDEYKEFPNRPEYGNGTVEKWPGCTKAVDDYFYGRPEFIRYDSEAKKYYIIKGA